MPFNELRKEDGVGLALPSCSRNARPRKALVGRAQSRGGPAYPLKRISLSKKKRVRRSLRSVARTERLNRFAPRAKSLTII